MTITRWIPPTTTTPQEEWILKRCRKKRKLFSFLREHRSQIFNDALHDDLEKMYRDSGAGKDAAQGPVGGTSPFHGPRP